MHQSRCSSVNVEKARQCLGKIRDIADLGASSWDPEMVGYALKELSQVLLERTGEDDRVFEPAPPDELGDLDALYVELALVDGFSQDMTVGHRCN